MLLMSVPSSRKLFCYGRAPLIEGETIGDFRFRVVRADSRRLYTLQIEPVTNTAPAAASASPPLRER